MVKSHKFAKIGEKYIIRFSASYSHFLSATDYHLIVLLLFATEWSSEAHIIGKYGNSKKNSMHRYATLYCCHYAKRKIVYIYAYKYDQYAVLLSYQTSAASFPGCNVKSCLQNVRKQSPASVSFWEKLMSRELTIKKTAETRRRLTQEY